MNQRIHYPEKTRTDHQKRPTMTGRWRKGLPLQLDVVHPSSRPALPDFSFHGQPSPVCVFTVEHTSTDAERSALTGSHPFRCLCYPACSSSQRVGDSSQPFAPRPPETLYNGHLVPSLGCHLSIHRSVSLSHFPKFLSLGFPTNKHLFRFKRRPLFYNYSSRFSDPYKYSCCSRALRESLDPYPKCLPLFTHLYSNINVIRANSGFEIRSLPLGKGFRASKLVCTVSDPSLQLDTCAIDILMISNYSSAHWDRKEGQCRTVISFGSTTV